MATDKIEVKRMTVGDLRVHPTAQRKLIPATLKKVDKSLDLEAIGAMHAVRYRIDGTLATWIVDGQHRWTVLRDAGLDDVEVVVMLHKSIRSDGAASDLFLKLNTRSAMSAFDAFFNELSAQQTDALGVAAICQKSGLEIERFGADGKIACVSTLKTLYRKDEGESLTRTLSALTAAYGHTASAVEGKLVDGLGRVFATYNGQVDSATLVKKLSKYPGGASALLGAAKGLRDYRGAPLGRCVGEVIVETYNRGRRAEKLTGF